MKVAILINELNIRGGTHKQVLRLCEYLRNKNVEVIIYTKYYEAEKTYPEFKEFNIVSLYKHSDYIGKKIKKLVREITDNYKIYKMISKDTDVINMHGNGFGLALIWLKQKKGKKIIWQINDLPFCFLVGNARGNKDKLSFKIKRNFYKKVAKITDYITVNVTKNKELVKECLEKEAKVFYCGVDRNDSLVLHEHKMCNKEITILSTGVFFKYRNYETLVEVADKLKKEGYKVTLNIIGETEWSKDYSHYVRDLVCQYDLKKEVIIWGQVDERKYVELYNQSDIFAFVNINQSWGLAVFEAMSCGMPVIVSDSVGAIELLNHGKDSIIVDPKDVDRICTYIKELYSKDDFYQNLSKNAYEIVKTYTWDELYSKKMYELFL